MGAADADSPARAKVMPISCSSPGRSAARTSMTVASSEACGMTMARVWPGRPGRRPADGPATWRRGASSSCQRRAVPAGQPGEAADEGGASSGASPPGVSTCHSFAAMPVDGAQDRRADDEARARRAAPRCRRTGPAGRGRRRRRGGRRRAGVMTTTGSPAATRRRTSAETGSVLAGRVRAGGPRPALARARRRAGRAAGPPVGPRGRPGGAGIGLGEGAQQVQRRRGCRRPPRHRRDGLRVVAVAAGGQVDEGEVLADQPARRRTSSSAAPAAEHAVGDRRAGRGVVARARRPCRCRAAARRAAAGRAGRPGGPAAGATTVSMRCRSTVWRWTGVALRAAAHAAHPGIQRLDDAGVVQALPDGDQPGPGGEQVAEQRERDRRPRVGNGGELAPGCAGWSARC